MKIVFNHINTLKKEAKRLHKSLKKFDLPTSLSVMQNLLSQVYGWQHFNQMSAMHDRLVKRNLHTRIDEKGYIEISSHPDGLIDGMRVAHGLSEIDRQFFIVKKRQAIESYLRQFDTPDDVTMKAIRDFFDERLSLIKVIDASVEKPESFYQLSSSDLGCLTVIRGGDVDQRERLYSSLPLANAAVSGGMFVVDNELARRLYGQATQLNLRNVKVLELSGDVMESHYPLATKVGLNVLEFNGTCIPLSHSLSHLIQIKQASEDVHHLKCYLNHLYLSDFFQLSSLALHYATQEKSLKMLEMMFIKPFLDMSEGRWVDLVIEQSNGDFTSYEALQKDWQLSRSLLDFFERMFDLLRDYSKLSVGKDAHFTVSSMVHELVSTEDNTILIVAYDASSKVQSERARCLLGEYRVGLAIMMGVRISDTFSSVVQSAKNRSRVSPKVVVFDDVLSMYLFGMGVVAKQASNLGVQFFYRIQSFSMRKSSRNLLELVNDINEPEVLSIIINATSVLHLTVFDDFEFNLRWDLSSDPECRNLIREQKSYNTPPNILSHQNKMILTQLSTGRDHMGTIIPRHSIIEL